MTYKQAKYMILERLRISGWQVKKELKTPWAKPPFVFNDPNVKLYFKAQSVWIGQGRPYHSLHVDPKKLALMGIEQLDNYLRNEMETY